MIRARLALLALLAAIGVLATGTSASAATVQLDGVRTTLTTEPGLFARNLILPVPVGPTRFGFAFNGGFALSYAFPITGGAVDSTTLAGEIRHSGGLRFLNVRNGRSLTLTNFTIDTRNAVLTAEVNGDPGARVPILKLDLGSAKVTFALPFVRVDGVGASLTKTAADALNATLGVSAFAEGIRIGRADVLARVAG